jgi:signal transduction histidine kinase
MVARSALPLLARCAARSRGWVLTVQDHGLGIPTTDLPRIFARFERAGNVAGHIPGTGLGLAAVRQVVEQHGGQIALVSQEGVGTACTVRLPLALNLAVTSASGEIAQ